MNGKMLYHVHEFLLRIAHLKKCLLSSVGKFNKEEKASSHFLSMY